MKKILFLMLCAALVLSLAACGAAEAEPAPASELTPIAPVLPAPEVEESSASDAAEAAAAQPPASPTDVMLDGEAFAAAEACVGLTLADLVEAVGEPDGDVSYAASCLEENAEDGMLFYDALGFYVWTVRGESGEIVHAVYPLD